jgi:[protein-PII] uridylyltransferase
MTKPVLLSEQISGETSPTGPESGPRRSWQERRDWLRARLQVQAPEGIDAEEMQAHFSGMPVRYWEQVSKTDLLWGLGTVHGFLKVVAASNAPATKPFVDWRQLPELGRTRVILCTWDRHGLLAKAAASFSAVRLNILEAAAFTRADNIVLDVFSVVDVDSGGLAGEARLREMFFLLEGALSEPPRFASLWMCSRHKYLVPAGQSPPRIVFDNDSSPTGTLVHIEASDRLGLLYDILQTLADAGLDITEAHIRTEDNIARDIVEVRDASGQKVLADDRLEQLRLKLNTALVNQ